jgi:hypothetical protein
MLKRLKAGYNPIDISIEKWVDIKETGNWTETGSDNCALCEVYHNKSAFSCPNCPLKTCGWDSPFHNAGWTRNAQIMIDALQKIKQDVNSFQKELLVEKTYSVGQKFKRGESKYILARCDIEASCVCYCGLINLEDGNTWAFAHPVKSMSKITLAEFKKIVGDWNSLEDFKEI